MRFGGSSPSCTLTFFRWNLAAFQPYDLKMTKIIKSVCLAVMLLPVLAVAQDAPPDTPASLRSNPENQYWVGGNIGLTGLTGIGSMTDVHLRYNFGRIGVIANWRVQNIHYDDPGDVRNSIFGLGATARMITFGSRRAFWRGAFLETQLLVEQGKSNFLIYDHSVTGDQVDLAGGYTSAMGATTGAEFYFPVYFGGWVTLGLGLDWMDWHYVQVPKLRGGYEFSGISNTNIYLRTGLSWSI